ncbi:Hypothetical protein A7982_03381 [Minicystis rosea]|nr:Hypothetical protein A7982_03381 [Minicystis rosea]
MALYELSIDGPLVREAEKVVSLEGRSFPTLVMRWDSRIFDQAWVTTIVLDYLIALPPLIIGQSTFNEVKLAAFVGGAPTKFMYFGTEMTANVPRIAPEMENSIAPAKVWQEFRLEEQTCPLPYLKLIQATPRIYGNGPQDYYSPPIKVERYDGVVSSTDHVADFFSSVVANLDTVKGSVLIDPARGFWNGARYVGVTKIAIVRQGKVVGMHQRLGRADKDPLPPEIKKRDPKLDVLSEWVGIDVGAASTVVALRGEKSQAEFVRIGESGPVVVSADYESPSEISFDNLGRTVKAWRDRVIMPLTRWGDVLVGQAARHARQQPGENQHLQIAATVGAVPLLRERIERHEPYKFRGLTDAETNEVLKRPAPPIIDEEGIGSHDPFDPVELYGYYIGLTVNHRLRGIHLKYAVTMPTGWSHERRQSVLVALRRGIFRSLPAGMIEYHDLDRLQVVDVGPASIPLSVHAFRTFNIQPKTDQIVFATIDAGASEMGMLFGILRQAKNDERSEGYERMVEYLEPHSIPWFGGERILHRLAYRVWRNNAAAVNAARAPFERPLEEPADEGNDLLTHSPEARANVQIIKDLLRPILEAPATRMRLPLSARLASTNNGEAHDVTLEIDREGLTRALENFMSEAIEIFKTRLGEALTKIGRDPDPYDGLRVILGGRVGLYPFFGDELVRQLPSKVQVHRFKEPEKNNLITPTVKTSCVLGVLGLKHDRIGALQRAEKRDAFRYRVGRNRHGQLSDVLDPTVEYDTWREMGACTKPDVEVLFMEAVDDGEVAADDPRVRRATAGLGQSAVGLRLYMRAVGPAKAELAAGPPGGEPQKGAPVWAIDLRGGVAEKI